MRHGSIELSVPSCTSCMICARVCPAWCIHIDAHPETVGDPQARRPRTVNRLDRFEIDWGLCMVCGMCIDQCPFDALDWHPSRPAPGTGREDLARVWTGEVGP